MGALPDRSQTLAGGSEAPTASAVPFGEAVRVWVRVGLQSFGGPAGQIAVMHRIVVDEKRWVSEERFLHALNYCMLLPGPEAQQLATYIGWLMHGYKGGLVAGSLFVLPGFVAILGLSYLYAAYQGVGIVAALFFGLKAAVLAVVIEAVHRIGKRVLKNGAMIAIAGLAFVGIFLFGVPFPVVVGAAALTGWVGGVVAPGTFVVIRPHAAKSSDAAPLLDAVLDEAQAKLRPSLARALWVLTTCLVLWFLPLLVVGFTLGVGHVFVVEGLFFSKAAVVTFGGAYAVLAYIAQQAVVRYGWLAPGEMLDGLGMAETTPGPLIQVVQFVGFMAAYRNPGAFDPWVAGTLGAVLTTWVTFVPCFLWIFLGAPYIEWLRGNQKLTAALSAITAAVVGVVLNLAVWFAIHVVFASVAEHSGPLGTRWLVPAPASIDWAALGIACGALVAMLHFKVKMLPLLGAAAGFGLLFRLFGS